MKHNTYFSVAPVPLHILHLVIQTIERQGWTPCFVSYCGNVKKSSLMTPNEPSFPAFVVIANKWHDGEKNPPVPVFDMETIEKTAGQELPGNIPASAAPDDVMDGRR